MAGLATAGLDDVGTRRAVEFLLHAVTDRLGMDGAFFASVMDIEQTRLVTTGASADSFTVFAGDQLSRLGSYVDHVVERDATWLVRDTRDEPLVCDLPVTVEGGLAAFLGVPVRAPDGQLLGIVGCLHHVPREDVDGTDVAVAEALAKILGLHLTQLKDGRATLGTLSARIAQLVDVVEAQELQLEIYRRMVDASLNATLLLDLETLQVEYANIAACELVGRNRKALLERHPWDLHLCWEEEGLRRELAPLHDRDAWPVTYNVPPIDGAPAMDVQAQRLTDPDGRAFVMWQGHDIETYHSTTDRLASALKLERQAGEQLQQLNRLKTAFLTGVSHEVRTPLTVVKGLAQLLQRGHLEPTDAPALLERLAVNADRLDRLLTDLLELNQFAHGAIEMQREPVDLAALVRRAVDDLELEDHTVAFELASIDLEVAPVKVERIVANLVSNAAVHTPPGTPIEVALTRHPDGALLVVTDHGEGIPAAERERVFEPFHQGDRIATHSPGTGIGLSLVAAFAELHGGTAWVEEAEAGGAAFHVLLPRAARPAAADSDSDPAG